MSGLRRAGFEKHHDKQRTGRKKYWNRFFISLLLILDSFLTVYNTTLMEMIESRPSWVNTSTMRAVEVDYLKNINFG